MMHGKKVVAIIPARFASTRFPGKPLVDLGGKPMIQRTYERVNAVEGFDRIVIATDDQRIFDVAVGFGAEVMMTAETHLTGTDRCAEVLGRLGEAVDYVVNIQGDEPFIEPEQLIEVAAGFTSNAPILTLIKKITDVETLFNTNTPKVIRDEEGNALYFSRQTIPFLRGVEPSDWLNKHTFFKHIGLYAYRADILPSLSSLKPTSLELAESLEQLRWVQNGIQIKAIETQFETVGIDSPADLEKIQKMGLI
ncbi:3-deoxy-manno-octulosonate cytidylyltransferase [Aquirufa sp. HETE-83D]|uniref:3-deoxy-manno-octulosonate cytidylyltransferase n=1 Tax=Aquirufa esocilacus TaxID=3096513 RepID=A0ABW6DHW3_9BACT